MIDFTIKRIENQKFSGSGCELGTHDWRTKYGYFMHKVKRLLMVLL